MVFGTQGIFATPSLGTGRFGDGEASGIAPATITHYPSKLSTMTPQQIQGALILIVLALGAVGWVANIVKMAAVADPLNGLFVVRAVGVFIAPLGAVMGYL